eukprot:TRINITY_DN19367_c0_g1_i1.p1 TRINITY_DN19367_c0_g1~~TRINITY_DN19367_c0_g1_i1.p1  ORF type:complete len:356 (-),score=82.45 TRINITY_DN19367_c0_g1_i1:265-1332(-)
MHAVRILEQPPQKRSQPPLQWFASFLYTWRGALVAITYALVSTSITFFNKAMFAMFDFKASSFLTLGQIIFSVICLRIMKAANLIDYPSFNQETSMKFGTLSLGFCGMVVTGLAALKYVNVPIYSSLRRLTTFIVVAGQYAILHKDVPVEELVPIVLMVLGALVASWGDLAFDLYGYLMTFLNCFITAVYLVDVARRSASNALSTWALMYYNNLMSIPLVIIITLSAEFDVLWNFSKWTDTEFLFCFWMSSMQAFLLNYFIYLCNTLNSPAATSITGQLKSIFQTILGLFLLGGVTITPLLVAGLTMSALGGVWYGFAKYGQHHSKTSLPSSRNDLMRDAKPGFIEQEQAQNLAS